MSENVQGTSGQVFVDEWDAASPATLIDALGNTYCIGLDMGSLEGDFSPSGQQSISCAIPDDFLDVGLAPVSPSDGSIRSLHDPLKLQMWECDALKAVCTFIPPEAFGQDLVQFGTDLINLAQSRAGGVGLAASQVGVTLRLFSMLHDKTVITACNPTIEIIGDSHSFTREGCLSTPGVFEPICRNDKVVLHYYEPLDGAARSVPLKGIWAHVAQHEMDHLEGQMFFSLKNMNNKSRKRVLGEWKRIRKHLPISVRGSSK